MASPLLQKEVSKDITAGIVITSLIFSASVFMPVIGFFFSIFIPLPILFYRSKLGRSTGLIIPVATLLIAAVIIGGLSLDTLFFGGLMLLGFSLSELLEKNLSIEKTIAFACLTVICTGGFALVFFSITQGVGIYSLISSYVAANLELSLLLYKGLGVPKETIDAISASMDHIQYVLVRLLPAFTVTSMIFVAWTNLLVAKSFFRKRGIYYPDFGPLNMWRAPEQIIWALIASGLMLMIPEKGLKMIGINGIIIMLTVYFFQGIAIVSYYFQKKKMPRLFRIILYCFIGIQQLALAAVIMIGVFDMWINFRKIDIKNS